MDRMELVEILRKKTGCSYADAKAAAEAFEIIAEHERLPVQDKAQLEEM